jgi:hypothetical protein
MVSAPRRRRPKVDTERQAAMRSSAAHLRDLKRAHAAPPPDVALAPVAIPRRIDPEPVASYCASPAQLCAELVP